ncbi:hypothetical protein IJJ12_00315 [bacterium]|nr:hypothetical protein [bacterium]
MTQQDTHTNPQAMPSAGTTPQPARSPQPISSRRALTYACSGTAALVVILVGLYWWRTRHPAFRPDEPYVEHPSSQLGADGVFVDTTVTPTTSTDIELAADALQNQFFTTWQVADEDTNRTFINYQALGTFGDQNQYTCLLADIRTYRLADGIAHLSANWTGALRVTINRSTVTNLILFDHQTDLTQLLPARLIGDLHNANTITLVADNIDRARATLQAEGYDIDEPSSVAPAAPINDQTPATPTPPPTATPTPSPAATNSARQK